MRKKTVYLLVTLAMLFAVVFAECGMAPVYNNSYVTDVAAATNSGWSEEDTAHTWGYSSENAAGNTFVISIDADVSEYIGKGTRIRGKQGGDYLYFVVQEVGAYAFTMPVTVFGIAGATISAGNLTDVAFSHMRFPVGIPTDPSDWMIEVTDTSTRTDAAPTVSVWSNVGGANAQISVPVGMWRLFYSVEVGATTTSNSPTVKATLSDSASVENYPAMTRHSGVQSGAITNGIIYAGFSGEDTVSLSSETVFYLLAKSDTTGVTQLQFLNASITMIIRAVSAYY